MMLAYDLVFIAIVIFHLIVISSGIPPKTVDLLANFGRSHEDAQNQGDSRAGPSSHPDGPNPPVSSHSDVRHHSPNPSSHLTQPPPRSRSRSPPVVYRSPPAGHNISKILGYGLDELESIRLIPYKNPERQFELRRYTFPSNRSLLVFTAPKGFRSVPTGELIVLSTLDGDVFGILDSHDVLAGIYKYDHSILRRARTKINMETGAITTLTRGEIEEIPVGSNRFILHGFKLEHGNHKDESLPSRCMTKPTRLPSANGSGYELDQLQFIRLIPKKNPNMIFELRRYTFPANKSILLLEALNRYCSVPNEEHIVLSTSAGDVFAILESMNSLAGIYTYNHRNHAGMREISSSSKIRSKINMLSGAITSLTTSEREEIPVGRLRSILINFRVQHVIHDLQHHSMH